MSASKSFLVSKLNSAVDTSAVCLPAFVRPVPLTHYLYTGINGKDKLHQIVDGNGRFDATGYKQATQPTVAAKAKAATTKRPTGRGGGGGGKGKGKGKGRGGRGGGATIKSFVQMVAKQELLPMVIFAFSKRKYVFPYR